MKRQELVASRAMTSLDKCLVTRNPAELLKFSKDLTFSTAIKGIQISKVKRERSESYACKLVSFLIWDLNEAFNINNKMTNYQINACAYDIIKDYWWLKLEELILCFKLAKKGDFGKIFRLDQAVIYEFIKEFDDRRLAIIHSEHKDNKSKDYQPRSGNNTLEELFKKKNDDAR